MPSPTAEKQKVIEAIGELGRRVTAADVATKTGLPILVVSQTLNEVASETGGHLQVGTTGDIAYQFHPGFSQAYLAKGIQLVLSKVLKFLWQVGFFLLRISFGVILLLSLLFIVTIILTFFLRGGGDRDRNDDDEGLGLSHLLFDYILVRDLFTWSHASRPVIYQYDRPTVRQAPQSNFFLNCFSFLFGDGDPNEGLDEKRWQLIAKAIRKNNYVMTAEQLAPYTGADPKDEDAVLPVLVRFSGSPEVTDSGNIVYVFPEMQSGAATAFDTGSPPAYLQEFPWRFTSMTPGALAPVLVVASLNFALAWFLWIFLSNGPSTGILKIMNVLVMYGTLFIVIPLTRLGINMFNNHLIAKRNLQRYQLALAAVDPDADLESKLIEAEKYKLRGQKLTEDNIVYTTERDTLEQDFDASPET